MPLNQPRTTPRQFRAIWTDDTQYCTLPTYVKRVFSVYVVDVSERVYICSLTPSVFARAVRHSVEYTPDATEEQREAFEEDIGYPEDTYFDAASVDRMAFVALDDPESDDYSDDADQKARNQLAEDLCANWNLPCDR